MAKPIKATPVLKGKDAKRILREVRNGTPDSEKRVETIRRADKVYRGSNGKAGQYAPAR